MASRQRRLGGRTRVEDGGCCGVALPTPVDDVGLTSVEDVAVRRFADVQKERRLPTVMLKDYQ